MGFFELSVMGGPDGPLNNFVAIALMVMKFGTGVKLDVFYTGNKRFATSLLLRHYDVITCIIVMHRPKFQMLLTSKPPD